MRFSLFYNPFTIIDRLAIEINRYKRKRKLKGTPAAGLGLGYIDSLELLELIKSEGVEIKSIFDVGANIGTWTLLAKAIFNDANVHAFEPLIIHTEKFNHLTRTLSKVSLHTFCLGSENGNSVINVSSFSDSSSLLNATPLEYEQYGIKKIDEEEVLVKRIDELIDGGEIPVPEIIKMDVQGYELEVLKGAGKYLNEVNYIIAEVSFKEYYHGQPLFMDIANYLLQYHFEVYSFGHSTPTGLPLGQIDVLFKRKR
jgi:FkbM family methyltransferase